MEDRWGNLAIAAYLRGIFNFRESSRYDPQAQLRERWVFDALEKEKVIEMEQLIHLWHCAAAQLNPKDSKETIFEFHRNWANKIYNFIGKMKLPWYSIWKTQDTELADLWKKFTDQMKDPEYVKLVEAARRDLKETTQKSVSRVEEKQALEEAKALLNNQETKRKTKRNKNSKG